MLTLMATVAVGSIALNTTWRLGFDRTIGQLNSVSALKTAEIDSFTDSMRVDLSMITKEPYVAERIQRLALDARSTATPSPDAQALARRFKHIAEISPRIDEVFLINRQGYLLISDQVHKRPPFRRHEDYFKAIVSEHRPFSISIQDRAYSSTAEQLNSIISTIPVDRDTDGVIDAVLGIRSSIAQLNRILGERSGMGESGETLLASANQSLITESRFPGFVAQTTFLTSAGIAETLADQSSREGRFIDYRGVPALANYTYMPVLNAVLIDKQDENEAIGPIYILLFRALLVVLLIMGVAVSLAVMLSRRLTQPLLALVDASAAVSAGNYSSPIPTSRNDEIGQLAKHFAAKRDDIRLRINDLAGINQELRDEIAQRERAEDELKQAHDQLEAKVVERTHELAGAKDRAEQASKAKGDFLAQMSHELRTPLNGILGFADIMQREELPRDSQIESLKVISKSGDHLLALINDILDTAKPNQLVWN